MFGKLLAIIVTVALGWVAGRMRWLGDAQADPARILSNAAFYIFVPALLFRTTARVDLGALPADLLVAYFVPTARAAAGGVRRAAAAPAPAGARPSRRCRRCVPSR